MSSNLEITDVFFCTGNNIIKSSNKLLHYCFKSFCKTFLAKAAIGICDV